MLSSAVLNNAIRRIVEHQVVLVGPLAVEQANKVDGLKVTNGGVIDVIVERNNPDELLTKLVQNYEKLFGRASIEVCRDAIREIQPPLPKEDLPQILQ